ncbi:MAG: YceH family protein [Taibaiella sp.]|jgi:hypothetical protein
MEEQQVTLPVLDDQEIRVLGALMEKARTTPEYYPMTVNGLTAACNQKTSRRPVVQYDEQTVILTLDRLKKKGLIATATGGTSRTVKYKHNFALVYQMIPQELAVICMLLLRGAQTPGELNTNSGRLYEFDSLDEVQAVLEKLSGTDTPFVKQLPRQAGQKEARYIHLLGVYNELAEEAIPAHYHSNKNAQQELEERVSILEQELSSLKEAFDKLMKELT